MVGVGARSVVGRIDEKGIELIAGTFSVSKYVTEKGINAGIMNVLFSSWIFQSFLLHPTQCL